MYNTDGYPEPRLCSTVFPIPKKLNARKCEDHKLISVTHILKMFLKLLHQRIYRECERDSCISQFGFRQNLGTE